MNTTSTSESVSKLLQESNLYIKSGDLDRAIVAIKQVFDIDKGNLTARTLFGLCAIGKGDLDAAEQNLMFVLDQDSDNQDAQAGMRTILRIRNISNLLKEARSHVAAERYDDAIPILQQVFHLDQDDLQARNLFGLCAVNKGDLDAAEQNFQFVLTRNSSSNLAQEGMRQLAKAKKLALQQKSKKNQQRPVLQNRTKQPKEKHFFRDAFIRLILFFGAIFFLVEIVAGPRSIDSASIFIVLLVIATLFSLIISSLIITSLNRQLLTVHQKIRPSPKKKTSALKTIFVYVPLWILLLAAGGFVGWMIGSEGGRNPDGGFAGVVVGVIVSQVIQAFFVKRSR